MSVPQQVVLTRAAVEVLIKQLSGVARLIAQLLCRGGLCVNECLRQRVRDVDFGQKMLIFRDVKGELR